MSSDVSQINQLLANYCHRVDRGTPEEVAALFAPDGVLKPRFDGDYDVAGRDAVRGWYAHYNKHLRDGIRRLKHMIHSISIEVDGNRAKSVCYFSGCFISNADDKATLVFGTYTDDLGRVEGTWLFLERTIESHIVLPGLEALEQFPSMGYAEAG